MSLDEKPQNKSNDGNERYHITKHGHYGRGEKYDAATVEARLREVDYYDRMGIAVPLNLQNYADNREFFERVVRMAKKR